MKKYMKSFKSIIFGSKCGIAVIMLVSATVTCNAAIEGLHFEGGTLKVLDVEPEKVSGLEAIYVVYDINGISLRYQSDSPVHFKTFSNLGAGFAEDVDNVRREGDIWILDSLSPDTGYILEADGRQHCFWIVEYKDKRFSLKRLYPTPESDCDAAVLEVEGSGAPIHYFTVNGQQRVLSRDIEVCYTTLEWNEKDSLFDQIPVNSTLASLSESLRISPAPLCSTQVEVTGDRFLKSWSWLQEATSPVLPPKAVEVRAEAVSKEGALPDNLIHTGEGDLLGGSAPCTIDFIGYITDGVAHTEWQMSRYPDFDDIEYRFTQQDVSYTFNEEGTFYLRFLGSNNDGSCSDTSTAYTVSIGASELLIPNAFSPNGDGINDEWKVAYRSLLTFDAWIFDRYGNQIKHILSPDQGWDGKRGGKPVPSGVYYYVIEATGSDGKKYKKSGDINLLKSVSTGESSTAGQ